MDTQCLLCEAGSDLLPITSTANDTEVTTGFRKLHNVILHDCILHQPIIMSRTRGVQQATRGSDENRIKSFAKKTEKLNETTSLKTW
jgi:hypothetical protein